MAANETTQPIDCGPAKEETEEEIAQAAREVHRRLDEYVAEEAQYRADHPDEKPPPLTSMQKKFRAHDAAAARGILDTQPEDEDTSHDPGDPSPGWYFFYGTLMDGDWLAEITGLDETPGMQPAILHKHHIRYWGPYPVLVFGWGREQKEVRGSLCYIPTLEAVEKVRTYETNHYKEDLARVDVGEPRGKWCRVFKWRNPDEEQYLAEFPADDPQPPLTWY